jgi:hypothetical protein
MKKFALFLIFCIIYSFTNSELKAQERFGSFGIEGMLPTFSFADIYSFGVGIFAHYEYGLTNKVALTGNIGTTFLVTDPSRSNSTETFLIPMQIGGRFYIKEQKQGLFLGAKIGAHYFRESLSFLNSEGSSRGYVNFSTALDIGTFINEHIAVSLAGNYLVDDYKDDIYVAIKTEINF